MPDQARLDRPTRLPLAVGGGAIALLLLAVGGYFVYQDQQDRDARAARAEYQNLRVLADVALEASSRDHEQRFQRFRATGMDVTKAMQQASTDNESGEPFKNLERLVGQLERLERRWGDRWRALGISPQPR